MNLQVLAVDCEYHSSCLVITTEKYRFLVDIGEGTQRLAIEHKVRLGKIAGILLTSGQTCSVGGLPGMLLTLDDSDVESPMIVAPSEAYEYLQSTQYFMRPIGKFNVINSVESGNALNFEEIIITPIHIPLSLKPGYSDNRLCILFQSPVIPGKFDLQKALELRIPKGPLFGKLKNGSSITLEDGSIVTPELVVGESTPSQYFAVVCRTDHEELIPRVTELDCWKE
jgi:ribonuclease Z